MDMAEDELLQCTRFTRPAVVELYVNLMTSQVENLRQTYDRIELMIIL